MARDQQILEAAEELFFQRSFDGVGVDEIGRAAGVSGSAIYRHFDSKDEILAVLFDQAIDGLLTLIPIPSEDPRLELSGLVSAHLEFANSRHRLAAIWAREQRSLAEPYRRSYQRRQHGYVQLWVECVSRCYPNRSDGDVITAVRGVHALLMSEAMRPVGGRRSHRATTVLTEIALAGLATLDVTPAA